MVDTSADYLCWDGCDAVTLEVATRAAPRPLAVPVAKRRSIRSSQKSPSGGVYVGAECRWLIPARVMPSGVAPKLADVIEDDQGERWTVMYVERNKGGQTYACGCIALTLALDLRDTVVIERATITHDAAGVPVKVFDRTLYTVAARVQETHTDVADERGVRYSRRRYEVVLERQVPDLDVSADRLRWQDEGVTRYLDLTGLRHSEEIDFLPVLDAEERL